MKILLFGLPGSGKTTMAKYLGELYKVPIFHLDKMFLDADRNKVSSDEGTQMVGSIMQQYEDRIMEGNYLSTDTSRIECADIVFLLDVPRWKCLRRVLGRVVKRKWGFNDGSLPDGAIESFDYKFYKWILTYSLKQELTDVCQKYGKKVHIVYSLKDILAMLSEL